MRDRLTAVKCDMCGVKWVIEDAPSKQNYDFSIRFKEDKLKFKDLCDSCTKNIVDIMSKYFNKYLSPKEQA